MKLMVLFSKPYQLAFHCVTFYTPETYPPNRRFRGVYWNVRVGPSVFNISRFPDDNLNSFDVMPLKLHILIFYTKRSVKFEFFQTWPIGPPRGVKNFQKINVSLGFRMITWILLMSCLWNFTYSFLIPKGRSSSKILNFCQKLNFWEIFQISKFGVKIDLCIHLCLHIFYL